MSSKKLLEKGEQNPAYRRDAGSVRGPSVLRGRVYTVRIDCISQMLCSSLVCMYRYWGSRVQLWSITTLDVGVLGCSFEVLPPVFYLKVSCEAV